MTKQTETRKARPVLKWAGGKGQLLHELLPRALGNTPIRAYHEPFVGGGALFFALWNAGRLDGSTVYLSDANDRLIEVYEAVREDVESLIVLLQEHKSRHGKEYYYAVRSEAPRTKLARAARLIYLNKTCFNGLFRENSKGQFNVPMGRYANPMICDADNLRAAAHALGQVQLTARSFETVLDHATPGDLVYFDPPYAPVSQTASFTKYYGAGFDLDDQRRLAAVFNTLGQRGVRALLSNSDIPFIRELYDSLPGAIIETVFASRSVNSRSDKRGAVSEVLVRNYPWPD